MLTVLLLMMLGPADVNVHRVTVSPIDFQIEDVTETLVQQIRQLETDGTHLYVRTENPYLLKLDPGGNLVQVIKMPETGPESFFRLGGFSLAGNRIVAVNEGSQVFWFEDGEFIRQYPSADFEAIYGFPFFNTNAFGFDGQQVLLPLAPGTDHLAVAHDVDGKELARVGTRPRIDPDYQDGFDTMNSAFWAWSGEHWLALFKFRPELRVYDKQFKLTKTIALDSPQINEAQGRFYDKEPLSRSEKKPAPFFFDFKARGNQAWFLAGGILHQVDIAEGRITDRYHFFGEGSDFEQVPEGKHLSFFMVAPLEDGRFVLGHPALMWNHDLWVGDPRASTNAGR